jgi:hypothetical protein
VLKYSSQPGRLNLKWRATHGSICILSGALARV